MTLMRVPIKRSFVEHFKRKYFSRLLVKKNCGVAIREESHV